MAEALLAKFKEAMSKPTPDIASASKLLSQLKIAMISFSSLPGTKSAADCNPKEILLARETYEYACLLSVALCAALPAEERGSDDQGFARHMAQVKTCYSDYASVLPSSPLQFQLQGLNLMFLLANSKIAEFHTELELIQVDQWENPYVHFPIKLEQYLMEGSYQKVLSSVGDVPAPSYNLFVNLLSGTVRDSIADSSEAASESLPIAEALRMLRMSSADELRDWAKSRDREWDVDVKSGVVRLREEHKTDIEMPSQKLIIETLSYAKELERIV
eukprot:CAMPEP_0172184522 /NCGR_PEP_ID=MMETSP1050-20130122/19627_1 /TAXON_ID=233186 /ORGANISM="Cryptomonas curvata, Strain CCAP979/52" /LENGTH=273 /DNA_ID=CAMNT_0012858339 /DNA_START=11 /DNA_END=832 /DNA_ORIENTATION=+